MLTQAAPVQAALPVFVRSLWSGETELSFVSDRPHIEGHSIRLPDRRSESDGVPDWHWYRAAAAHAAAHLTFSPPIFEGRGLGPIPRALLGVLEDARVEALACRELPGLRRLWTPLHTVTPAEGDGFEALLLRLSRALLDPAYVDDHPWVEKGRALFYPDDSMQILLLRRPDELRLAATLLGHDIGQMRLQFNSRMYLPGPDYRDDSRWMWASGQDDAIEQRIEQTPALVVLGDEPAPLAPPVTGEVLRYPEWDRLIDRLRHDWCSVAEQSVDETGIQARPAPLPPVELTRALVKVIQRIRSRRVRPTQAADQGEQFDLDEVVRLRIAQRRRAPTDPRVFRSAASQPQCIEMMILIDQSASSADAWVDSTQSVLEASCMVASSLASALQACGHRVSMAGFSSNGRHAVTVRPVKSFAQAMGSAVNRRLASLRSRDSTRLGAAVRHATRSLVQERSRARKCLLIVGDGLPWDVDVHDPSYLQADARDAVRRANREGVEVLGIVLDPHGAKTAKAVFGSQHTGVIESFDRLPGLIGRLMV
jgi:hypothetical protein